MCALPPVQQFLLNLPAQVSLASFELMDAAERVSFDIAAEKKFEEQVDMENVTAKVRKALENWSDRSFSGQNMCAVADATHLPIVLVRRAFLQIFSPQTLH